MRKNHKNKIEELKLSYLIDTYKKLANASNRKPFKDSPYFKELESAIADIQLFGTEDQINLVHNFANEFREKNAASTDNLLFDLRKKLREELNLSKIDKKIVWVRFEGSPNPEAYQLK